MSENLNYPYGLPFWPSKQISKRKKDYEEDMVFDPSRAYPRILLY